MSGAAKKGAKFNKTKRGGPRTFTDAESIDRSVAQLEKLRVAASDSDASDSDSDVDVFGEAPPRRPQGLASDGAIYRSADRPILEIGKIEIEEPVEEFKTVNANRAVAKNLKASDLSSAAAPATNLSRKEKEALEAERKKAAFWKAQAEGKTDQAKSDLARLAIIKKQREEAAARKAEEAA
ncbi:heat- and acid-stable phosphoprotein, partial [Rhizoclosmatium hyalinum]